MMQNQQPQNQHMQTLQIVGRTGIQLQPYQQIIHPSHTRPVYVVTTSTTTLGIQPLNNPNIRRTTGLPADHSYQQIL